MLGRSALGVPETHKASGKAREPDAASFKTALEAVQHVLPEDCVAFDRTTLVAHAASSWSYHKTHHLPGVVLYPRSTEDVVEIVKIASKYHIPIVPFCGGTSLEGHFNSPNTSKDSATSFPTEDQLKPGFSFTLDFSENMNNILEVHEMDLDCVVQPGVPYELLNSELADRGIPLFFPVDPGPGAQIGGMVASGCSGTNAVKYGTMRENVINLTVVTADGTVVKTRQRAKKSSAGPNLGQLFVGSEGTLGLITEATLKLAPVLPTSVGVSSFPTVEHAADAVADLVRSGIGLACIELLDDNMMKAINLTGNAGRWDEKPSLFLKFTGTEGQIKSDKERTVSIVKKHSGSKMKLAGSKREADDLWYARKSALWASIDMVPGSKAWTTDVCVPLSSLPKLVKETKADLEANGLISTIVSHAGDGNFHCIIMFTSDEEMEKVKGCVHRMVKVAQDLDGTCTGEHGVGIGKMYALERELGVGTIGLLRSIKKTMDPKNIMNPGKLIPPEGKSGH